MPSHSRYVNTFLHQGDPTPGDTYSHPFGTLCIGDTVVALEVSRRVPVSRGYFLDDDEPAIVFGPDADCATVANGIMAMVMLLNLNPQEAIGQEVAHG